MIALVFETFATILWELVCDGVQEMTHHVAQPSLDRTRVRLRQWALRSLGCAFVHEMERPRWLRLRGVRR